MKVILKNTALDPVQFEPTYLLEVTLEKPLKDISDKTKISDEERTSIIQQLSAEILRAIGV